jgi:hypothetical protein
MGKPTFPILSIGPKSRSAIRAQSRCSKDFKLKHECPSYLTGERGIFLLQVQIPKRWACRINWRLESKQS